MHSFSARRRHQAGTARPRGGNARKRERGNAMVELALVCGILLPFLAGIFQFGYGFYTYNRLVAGVRAGARYGSLLKYDSATSTPSTTFANAVKNITVYGDPSGGTQPIVPGLTTSQINVTVTMVSGTPDTITVSVSSFSLNTVFKTLTFTSKPAASFRYSGVFAPV